MLGVDVELYYKYLIHCCLLLTAMNKLKNIFEQ